MAAYVVLFRCSINLVVVVIVVVVVKVVVTSIGNKQRVGFEVTVRRTAAAAGVRWTRFSWSAVAG